ncbi:alpha/beta-hydrolase [Ceratobasidium sp. AG-I]|nr:alpha/beta-hydrolase [Ceratobasidium sp. AG-I]
MASEDEILPFTISVSDQELHELSAKLDLTRLPDELDLPPGQEWDWGIPLAVLKPVVEYWRTKYDWRAVEERLNRTLPQFTTHIDTPGHGFQEVHFVHKRSENPEAIPLIFVHGWPGNFLEASKMIDELANPKDPTQPSFHVVAPSLPGFVFSQRAGTPGIGARTTAFVFNKLMMKLGYKHYLAQGGDWGALVCRGFAVYHQDTCLGTHQNYWFSGAPTFTQHPWLALKTVLGFAGLPGGYSKHEIEGLKRAAEFVKTGSGYANIQETKPQTLAVGLTDSPVGLLAWIGEKLYAWTDNYAWTPEELITWTMLYWIKGPAGGLRFYKENVANVLAIRASSASECPIGFQWSPTPFGFSRFPKEIIPCPLEWAGLRQNLVYSKEHQKGGHFAAWEVPELLADDIRKFAQIVQLRDSRLRESSR